MSGVRFPPPAPINQRLRPYFQLAPAPDFQRGHTGGTGFGRGQARGHPARRVPSRCHGGQDRECTPDPAGGKNPSPPSSPSPAVARPRQHGTAEARHFRTARTRLAAFSLLPDNALAPAGHWRPSLSPCLFKGKGSPAASGPSATRLCLGLAALQQGRPPAPGVASLAPGRRRSAREARARRAASCRPAPGRNRHATGATKKGRLLEPLRDLGSRHPSRGCVA